MAGAGWKSVVGPANGWESVDTESSQTHLNVLERTVDCQSDSHKRLPAPTGQTGYGNRSDQFFREIHEDLKPRARTGRTLSELVDLWLLLDRQATQNALERRREARRTVDVVGKVRVGG